MRKQLLLASTLLVLSSPLAHAAGCLEQVEQVAQKMGVMKSIPGLPGASQRDTPATTESRGIPPEVTSRLTGTGTPTGSSAGRQGEAVGMLQSARAASAQGNEQECFSQLAKAREKLEGK